MANSSLAKCTNKTKKTPHGPLNAQTFLHRRFFPSTRKFSLIFPKKSPDFFIDFLRKNRSSQKLVIFGYFGDLLPIFVIELFCTCDFFHRPVSFSRFFPKKIARFFQRFFEKK
jgi:hypothetical protein